MVLICPDADFSVHIALSSAWQQDGDDCSQDSGGESIIVSALWLAKYDASVLAGSNEHNCKVGGGSWATRWWLEGLTVCLPTCQQAKRGSCVHEWWMAWPVSWTNWASLVRCCFACCARSSISGSLQYYHSHKSDIKRKSQATHVVGVHDGACCFVLDYYWGFFCAAFSSSRIK